MLALSFASYAMLVDFHLATPKLATDTHVLELWSILAVVAFMALEVAYPKSVLLSLGRGYSMILSGAWWHIIGNILFGGECMDSKIRL